MGGAGQAALRFRFPDRDPAGNDGCALAGQRPDQGNQPARSADRRAGKDAPPQQPGAAGFAVLARIPHRGIHHTAQRGAARSHATEGGATRTKPSWNRFRRISPEERIQGEPTLSSRELNKLRTIELDRRKLLLGALATGAVLPIAFNAATGTSVYAQASEDGGTLIFNNGTNPSGLDPHITGAVASWYVMDQVFDRLLRLDPDTSEPGPSLAESFEVSDDGLTYTFKLRSGVTFSNGRELTSDDVKWSFERIQNPDVPAVAKGYFVDLASIDTPDASTVVLTYSKPFAPLTLALCRLETSILPKEAVEDAATWEVTPTGSGPFVIESNVKDQGVVLVRNDNYWEEGLPILAKVEHRIIPQSETAIANIRTGDIQGTEVPPKDIESLSDDDGVNVEVLTSSLWPHLSVNTQVAPFDNLQVRQAIRCGFNRDDIAQAAFYGTG